MSRKETFSLQVKRSVDIIFKFWPKVFERVNVTRNAIWRGFATAGNQRFSRREEETENLVLVFPVLDDQKDELTFNGIPFTVRGLSTLP